MGNVLSYFSYEEKEVDIGNASHDEKISDDESVSQEHIGARFNQWRKPVANWGNNPAEWEVKLKSTKYVGDIEFGRKEWGHARAAVDTVLKLIMKEVKCLALGYEGLQIERYIRQGSSREGLKVVAPDEFDALLQFHFKEMSFRVNELRRNGVVVPEFCYLEPNQTMAQLQNRLPKLSREGAFFQDGVTVRINAKMLHQIFESIIDRATDNVVKQVHQSISSGEGSFRLTRKMNPPSVNVTIHLNDEVNTHFMPQGAVRNPQRDVREIDLDIVPALLIRTDYVERQGGGRGSLIECPVYAVFKWMEDSRAGAADFPQPALVWRISSSGMEKLTLDTVALSQTDRRQLYIITAMRILKTYFVKTKKLSRTPPQVATVLKSYHLKHLAFYLILYVCYIHTNAKIDGVQDALRYYFMFLRESLTKGKLPHFFHSNPYITRMYPSYQSRQEQLRFNLLRNKSPEALNQALLSLNNQLIPDLGFTKGGYHDPTAERVKQDYSGGISVGQFF